MVTNLQNRLINHRWITSRVFVPAQDLSTGTLKLVVIAGKVAKVIFTSDSSTYSNLYVVMPAHKNSLLDLRYIEQGLENLQRLPTVQVSIEMVSGETPIIINHQQSRY